MLDRLITASAEYDVHKHDTVVRARELRYDAQARLQLPQLLWGQLEPLEPTEWACKQVYAKLGPVVFGKGSAKALPYDYLTALRPELRAELLNDHLAQANGREWLVRGYAAQARAVLDGGYPCVSNTELLTALDELLQAEAGRCPDLTLVRPHLTPDDLNLKLVWRNVRPSGSGDAGGQPPYGIGVYLGNGEIGNRKLRLWPLVQRHSCTNSIIVQHDEGLELVHRGSVASMMVLLKAALGRVLRASADVLDRLIKAEAERIPDVADVLDGLALQYGWSQDVRLAVAFGMEGRPTRAGLAGGIAYAAHQVYQEDGNAQADMEVLAGSVLLAEATLFGKAAWLARTQRDIEYVER